LTIDNVENTAQESEPIFRHFTVSILKSSVCQKILKELHVSRLFLMLFLALLVAANACMAESTENSTFRLWQTQDGLPENTVQSFAQTNDGFLWIGTTGGLVRFDGETFETFDQSNTPAFKESSVLCLLVSRDSSLWIGTEGGGLIRFHNGIFKRYSVPEGLHDAFVRSIFEDREGSLWVGTDGSFYQWTGDQTDRFESNPALARSGIQAISQDRDGRLWLGGVDLNVLDRGQNHQERLNGRPDALSVKSILQTHEGTMWVGTSSGLYRRRLNEHIFTRVAGIEGGVRRLMEAADSTLWIGTVDDGMFSMRNGKLSRLTASSSVPTNTILAIFQDRDGNIWIGTQAGLLQMLRSSVHIIHLPGKSESDFSTVYLDSEGILWVAARRLFAIRDGVATPVSLPELRGANVRNVLRDRAKTLWFGTNGSGLYHLTRQGVVHYTVENGLVNNFIRVMTQAHDGAIWVGTDSGMSRVAGSSVRNFGMNDGLCYSAVQAIVQTPDGDVWIGTSRGLSHLHNNKFQDDDVTRRLKSDKVWTLNVSPDGGVWIGTRNDGLYGYDHGRLMHFTTAEGLGSNSIYKLLSDNADHLWFSGPGGVSMVNLSDLYAQADNPSKEIFPHFYYISDGKEAVQFYGGMQPGGWVGLRGDVWFPSNHGPVQIVPDAHLSPLPRLRIKHASVDGKEDWDGKTVRLAPDSSTLEITYSSILLIPQDGIRYRYKLEGLDKNWTNAFGRRTAYFTNIPAGTYMFHVQGYDTDHPQSHSDASVIVIKRPHFYSTPWFLTCAGVLLCLLLWSGYGLKVRRAQAQFRAILEERSRLAREIHETILQGCASISSFLEASASAEVTSQLREELVDYARNQISATMDEARQAVWNLRQPGDAPADVKRCIKELADRTSKEFGIRVECNFDDSACVIDQPTMHEVTMIAREALYNALVHSSAGMIEIATRCESGQMAFSVRDNGIGFDPSQVSFDNHYGLTGMQERVKRLGGSFALKTKVGGGTEVHFSIRAKSRDTVERV
jgi:ligand-binding sensor domain-containing protein/signal transduction histidine kinase